MEINLPEYYQYIKDDIDKMCSGCAHCTTCTEEYKIKMFTWLHDIHVKGCPEYQHYTLYL